MADFVLSKLLTHYLEDGSFTGSSMNKAIEAARVLEAAVWPDRDLPPSESLVTMLRYMAEYSYTDDDLVVAIGVARRLERWLRTR